MLREAMKHPGFWILFVIALGVIYGYQWITGSPLL